MAPGRPVRPGGRTGTGIAAAFAAVMILFACALATGATPADAQERIQRGSIIEFLFGNRNPPRVIDTFPPPPPAKANRPKKPAGPRASGDAPKPEANPVVEKAIDARKVLVVGDFMASALAAGLDEAFSADANVVVVNRANGSSGLVRNDYYDWPASIGAIIEEEHPAAVVVLLGSNDRQQMSVAGTRESVRSEGWTAEYTARAEALAAAVRKAGVPLLWLGAPAFPSPAFSADIVAFNGIFNAASAKAGGEFVDVWDGFVDENGKFVFTGSDINGQPVRLRASDGIVLTAAGKRKLAFYAEKPLRRMLDVAAPAAMAATPGTNAGGADVQGPNMPGIAPALPAPDLTRTKPIRLNDPELDGGAVLLGAAGATPGAQTPAAAGAMLPVEKLVHDGEAPEAPAGRADSFMAPSRGPEASTSAKDANPSAASRSAPEGTPAAKPETTGAIE